MVSKFLLSIVFWGVISLSVLTNGETDCIRIYNCPAYSWLENPGTDSGFSSRDIIRQLNRIHCGWESQNRLIHCPSGNGVEGTNKASMKIVAFCISFLFWTTENIQFQFDFSINLIAQYTFEECDVIIVI